MWTVHLDNLSRLLGEEGNPLHSPDVSSTRLRGGHDTTLQVTSKDFTYILSNASLHCLSFSAASEVHNFHYFGQYRYIAIFWKKYPIVFTLKWVEILTRQNDADSTGSGYKTLLFKIISL
jgi:hypothetical protein